MNKNRDTSETKSITEELKTDNSKYNLSKFEFDLYDEESNKPHKVVRVKRFSMPNKGEKWKIFEDNKIMFVVEGSKLNNKEKAFLRTVEGVSFLLSQYKNGIKSFNALKNELKQHIGK
jgi:hypothetical protein